MSIRGAGLVAFSVAGFVAFIALSTHGLWLPAFLVSQALFATAALWFVLVRDPATR